MELEKLDFSRPVRPRRLSRPTATEPENKVMAADISGNNFPAVPFAWEITAGHPKHEGKLLTQDAETHHIASVKSSDCAITDASSAARTPEIFDERTNSLGAESASTQNENFHRSNHSKKRSAGTYTEPKHSRSFSSCPKAIMAFQCCLSLRHKNSKRERQPEMIPVVENTRYIDSGHGSDTPSTLALKRNIKRFPDLFHDKTYISADVNKATKAETTPFIPPLPNSPSDPWLSRALPLSMSSGNLSPRSRQESPPMRKYSKQQAPKLNQLLDPIWVPIKAKTSVRQRAHRSCSQVMLAPIPELDADVDI